MTTTIGSVLHRCSFVRRSWYRSRLPRQPIQLVEPAADRDHRPGMRRDDLVAAERGEVEAVVERLPLVDATAER